MSNIFLDILNKEYKFDKNINKKQITRSEMFRFLQCERCFLFDKKWGRKRDYV